MKKIHGTCIFPGTVIGPVHRVIRSAPANENFTEDPDAAIAKYMDALKCVKEELAGLAADKSDPASEIYEIHGLLLEDEMFTENVMNKILNQKMSPESAVESAGHEISNIFRAMDDEYMSARAEDIVNVSMRLTDEITGNGQTLHLSEPSVIVAEEFMFQDFSSIDRSMMLGVITAGGSPAAHTAIILRTYGIPSVFEADIDLNEIEDGETVILDAEAGEFITCVDSETLENYREKERKEKNRAELLQKLKGLPDETQDGQKIKIFANIENPETVSLALENDARGIGLFRSEFLFMNRISLPSEEEQFAAYKNVLESMNGQEVVIRTMDIGADKKTECLNLRHEANPQLGKRAIRICLDDPELFRTQLRALLRSAVYGDLHIMYPMITSVSEINDIKAQVELSVRELEERGESYRVPPQGIMIETPAAAITSDLLAQEVDFFSIGTNDLTQYTLAVDRQGEDLERFFDPYHPAIMRLIKMTVENAHRYGIWTGICGELAGDPILTETFIEYGVDELSMSPAKILPIRSKVREYKKR